MPRSTHGQEYARRQPRTALLLIDFMNPLDFVGAKALARPATVAAKRTAVLKERLRASRVPAIYANDNFGRWESDFEAVVEHCRRRGGASAQLAELLAPAKGDRCAATAAASRYASTSRSSGPRGS